jgi:hypothetical protein
MMRKSVVEVMEEVLASYQPGSRISYQALERLIRVHTPIWQGFKIRDLIRSLEARRVIEHDGENLGMLILWPDKVNTKEEGKNQCGPA